MLRGVTDIQHHDLIGADEVVDGIRKVAHDEPAHIVYFRGAPLIRPELQVTNGAPYERGDDPRGRRIVLADVAADGVEILQGARRVAHAHRAKRSYTSVTW